MVTMNKVSLLKFIKDNQFSIRVLTNSNEDSLRFDPDKGLILKLKAKAQDNKANLALMKYFKKEYGLNINVQKGLKSREKILALTN